MKLGLGTGSTVAHFLDALGERLRSGSLTGIVGAPTSERTEAAARRLAIPLGSLTELGTLDLTVDGADEVDPGLDLIKGLGGALLREKMVAQVSRRFLVIADARKRVESLGTTVPLPVEVVRFEHESHLAWLRDLGAEPELRVDPKGVPYVTDNGNFIIHCRFRGGIGDTLDLQGALAARAGIVETGLFLGFATEALIAGDGGVEEMAKVEAGSGAGA